MTTPQGTNPLLTAALDYAARGWHVFPCHLDKTPATPHGVKDATTDPARIRGWWQARPDASIGVACGPSGLVAVDIDPGKGGFDTWARLKAAHNIDDNTLTNITGSGGWHLIYRAPAGCRVRNSAGRLGPGLDVRAAGGYIIVPPSGHPTGSHYIWNDAHPEPIPLPANLAALLEPPKPAAAAAPPASGYAAAALRGELAGLAAAREGTRNHLLNRAAFSLGQLVAAGELDRATVEAVLLAAAARIGLSEPEARATVKSGLDAGAREMRAHWPPPSHSRPNFTSTAVPAWLDDDALAAQLAAAPEGRRVHLLTAGDALAPRPALPWLIDGLALPGSVGLLYGPPGAGKTYTFMDLAVCVARGVPWLDLPVEQAAVLIIDEESGAARSLNRLAEALRGHQADATTPVYIAALAGFNFRDAAALADLQTLITQVGARLVIIDALADVMLGGDENAVKDTQPVFHGLRMVAEATAAAVLVVHHANRAGGYRGSSAIFGAVDVVMELARRKDTLILNLTVEKNRDGEPFKLMAAMRWAGGGFNLIPLAVTDAAADAPAAAAAAPGPGGLSSAERYVLTYLTEHGPSGNADLAVNAAGCTADTARNALNHLCKKGLVRRCNEGGRGVRALYEAVQPAAG